MYVCVYIYIYIYTPYVCFCLGGLVHRGDLDAGIVQIAFEIIITTIMVQS